MRKRKAACFPEFNYTLQWRKVKRRVLHAVLMYNGLLQEDAAGSSSQSQSQSDSRTAAGTSSSTSESAGTASKTITNTLC